MQVVEAIKKILYAGADDEYVVEEAQAMISSSNHQQIEPLGAATLEETDEKLKSDSQKRKNIINVDLDAAANSTSSPRQRLSDASDIHCSGSPLVTY